MCLWGRWCSGAIVPRMLGIRALRETEKWTGASKALTVIVVLALLSILVWMIYRYLKD
jgi:hypothetical protein